MSKRRTGDDRVHTITSTQGPLGADIDRRARRYLVQMVIRTLCFLGAVATWGRVPTAVSVTLLIGAVVLPYVAVVLANAGRERPERADSLLELREITGAPLPPPVSAPTSVPPRAPSGTSTGPSGAPAPGRAPWDPGPDGTGRG